MGLELPGWTCVCGLFNGEAKERRARCRTCDAERPPVADPARELVASLRGRAEANDRTAARHPEADVRREAGARAAAYRVAADDVARAFGRVG